MAFAYCDGYCCGLGGVEKREVIGMADRDKVIKGLEYCIKSEDCRGCIYWEEIGLHEGCPLNSDVLELLKEQEAIKQTYHVMMNQDYENPVEVTRYDWLCPTCKSLLCRDIDVIDDNYHFCKVCGQAVKWDG